MARTPQDEMTVVDFPGAIVPTRVRVRNAFPPPPSNRPRVFEREPDIERTSLRPASLDERTQLRPSAAPLALGVPLAPQLAPLASPPTVTAPTAPTSTSLQVDAMAMVRTWLSSHTRVVFLAAIAVMAPIVAALVVVGTEERASARVSAMPPVTEQAMLTSRVAVLAAVTASPPEVTAAAPLVVATTAPLATTRDVPSHTTARAPTAPFARAFAMTAAVRSFATASTASTPTRAAPLARARAEAPAAMATSAMELPASQAADALARAQLEAALR
jgi:hypothetical protein